MIQYPEQYSILPSFSENTMSNVSKVYLCLLGSKDDIDLTIPLDWVPVCGLFANCFSVSYIGSVITVTEGVCVIDGGIFIETMESVSFSVIDTNSYLFKPSDGPPSSDGTYTLYVCGYYDSATMEDMEIGIINSTTYLSTNRSKICVFGVLSVVVSSGVITIIEVITDDPTYPRDDVKLNMVDGGWIL